MYKTSEIYRHLKIVGSLNTLKREDIIYVKEHPWKDNLTKRYPHFKYLYYGR